MSRFSSPEHDGGRRPEASPEKKPRSSRLWRLGTLAVGVSVGLSLLQEVSSSIWHTLTHLDSR